VHTRREFLGRSLAITAGLGAAGLLAACGDDDDAADATGTTGDGATTTAGDATATTAAEPQPLTVMMPFPLSPNFVADVAAVSSGAMEAAGVDMDLQFATGAPQALQMLAAGNVHVIRNGPVETIQAVVNEGAPFVTIGMVNQRTNYTLTSLPDDAYTLADLGGLTVGLPTLGGNAELTFDVVLGAAGVDPSTVERQAVGNEASAYGVLAQGVVDALFVTTSAVAAIRATGEEPHVDELPDVNPLLGTNLVTTRQVIEERRDTVVAYLRALHDTMVGLHDEGRRGELIAAVAADDQWDLPQFDDPDVAGRIVASVVEPWFVEGDDLVVAEVEVDRAEGGDGVGARAEALGDAPQSDRQRSASSRRSLV
jgi:ABC-type nitrate/sulfonate/bicarbonate transport system substrate-binding protein